MVSLGLFSLFSSHLIDNNCLKSIGFVSPLFTDREDQSSTTLEFSISSTPISSTISGTS